MWSMSITFSCIESCHFKTLGDFDSAKITVHLYWLLTNLNGPLELTSLCTRHTPLPYSSIIWRFFSGHLALFGLPSSILLSSCATAGTITLSTTLTLTFAHLGKVSQIVPVGMVSAREPAISAKVNKPNRTGPPRSVISSGYFAGQMVFLSINYRAAWKFFSALENSTAKPKETKRCDCITGTFIISIDCQHPPYMISVSYRVADSGVSLEQ